MDFRQHKNDSTEEFTTAIKRNGFSYDDADQSSLNSTSSSAASSTYSTTATVGLIGNNGIIEDVEFPSYPSGSGYRSRSHRKAPKTPTIQKRQHSYSTPPAPKEEQHSKESPPSLTQDEDDVDDRQMASPTSPPPGTGTGTGATIKTNNKKERVLRSSLSAHSFKQAFKLGVSRQQERKNSTTGALASSMMAAVAPATGNTNNNSSSPAHGTAASTHFYQPPTPQQAVFERQSIRSSFSRNNQHHRSVSGATTETANNNSMSPVMSDIGAGSGGAEIPWGYARPRIFQAMKEYKLLEDGSPVQWISSLNITWSSGIGYIRKNGALALQGEEDNLHIPNLRAVKIVASLRQRYIEMIVNPAQNGCTRLIITPTSDVDFFKWTGALLLWSNLKPHGLESKISMPPLELNNGDQNILVAHFRICFPHVTKSKKQTKQQLRRRASTTSKRDISSPILQARSENSPFANDIDWMPAVGVLKESGVMEILNESDGSLIQSINMPSVLSSRIRKIDYSLFDCPHVLYIQPSEGILQSNLPKPPSGQSRQYYFYAAFKDFNDYEDWYSVLKSVTRKRIFSPTSLRIERSFRTSRRINIRVIEAKADNNSMHSPFDNTYVEVVFEGLTWARTFVSNDPKPFWREDFEFDDFPVRTPPSMRLVVKRRLGLKVSPKEDPIIGHVDIRDSEIIQSEDIERWLPLTMAKDEGVTCSLCIRVNYQQIEILAKEHYDKLHQLITGNVANNLTIQLADHLPNDLNKLSDILLNIFQCENKSVEWITSLIAGELGKIRESFTQSSSHITSDFRFNVDNTLFRGNSLVTKAIERYMKLVGHDYLDKIVGGFVRKVVESGLFLEVDPNRIPPQFIPEGQTAENVSNANQERLTKYVSYLWSTIRDSTDEMPYSFKLLFKRLRLDLSLRLQQDEPVIFNAVSGFLFLRFFCPALLNPKVVGLVRAHPVSHVQRSLTLVAKMLQGFANRVRFGLKEPWMVPMNSFIDGHDTEMVEFYRDVTLTNQSEMLLGASGITTERPFKEQPFVPAMGDTYSNPYLIDQMENFALLVELWATRDNSDIPAVIKPNGELQSNHTPTTIIDANVDLKVPPSLRSGETVRPGFSQTERPISTVSSKFEDAISDALESEGKRTSTFSKSSSAVSSGAPVTGSTVIGTAGLLADHSDPPMKQSFQSPRSSSSYDDDEDRKLDNRRTSSLKFSIPQPSNKRNTLVAMQEDALKQFELETLKLHSKCYDIEQSLTNNEIVQDEDLDYYIANTFFTFNPDSAHITLKKYAVGFAQAAAAAAQQYSPQASQSSPRRPHHQPQQQPLTPNSPSASTITSSQPNSPYMGKGAGHQWTTMNSTISSSSTSPDFVTADDDSDKHSTMSRRFPRFGIRLKRK